MAEEMDDAIGQLVLQCCWVQEARLGYEHIRGVLAIDLRDMRYVAGLIAVLGGSEADD